MQKDVYGHIRTTKTQKTACAYAQADYGISCLQTESLDTIYDDTDSPPYTDTRYNDKIRYKDNLTVTKYSLKK